MNDVEIIGFDIEDSDVPRWHKDIIREGLENHQTDKSKALDFDDAMDEIEKEL
jgi:hypothetical protein